MHHTATQCSAMQPHASVIALYKLRALNLQTQMLHSVFQYRFGAFSAALLVDDTPGNLSRTGAQLE